MQGISAHVEECKKDDKKSIEIPTFSNNKNLC